MFTYLQQIAQISISIRTLDFGRLPFHVRPYPSNSTEVYAFASLTAMVYHVRTRIFQYYHYISSLPKAHALVTLLSPFISCLIQILQHVVSHVSLGKYQLPQEYIVILLARESL